eukprot:4008291-Prymnesium_polylepis.1
MSDEYFQMAGGVSFLSLAESRGLSIRVTVNFATNAVDFSAPLQTLQHSGARVILLGCLPIDGARFMREAMAIGIGGDGYL